MGANKIKRKLELIRFNLPDPKPIHPNGIYGYKFRGDYKENHFQGPDSDATYNDIKCHILAGKWEALEERNEYQR